MATQPTEQQAPPVDGPSVPFVLRDRINIRRIDAVDIVEVIRVSITMGDGSAANPSRSVDQYWSRTGEFLAERSGPTFRKKEE